MIINYNFNFKSSEKIDDSKMEHLMFYLKMMGFSEIEYHAKKTHFEIRNISPGTKFLWNDVVYILTDEIYDLKHVAILIDSPFDLEIGEKHYFYSDTVIEVINNEKI